MPRFVHWDIVCYHVVSDGDNTRTVISHKASGTYHLTGWRDTSPALMPLYAPLPCNRVTV